MGWRWPIFRRGLPPQYRQRCGVSLPCSGWERVVPPRSNHQHHGDHITSRRRRQPQEQGRCADGRHAGVRAAGRGAASRSMVSAPRSRVRRHAGVVRDGGAEGARTPDLRRARAALSQLSYGPSALESGLRPYQPGARVQPMANPETEGQARAGIQRPLVDYGRTAACVGTPVAQHHESGGDACRSAGRGKRLLGGQDRQRSVGLGARSLAEQQPRPAHAVGPTHQHAGGLGVDQESRPHAAAGVGCASGVGDASSWTDGPIQATCGIRIRASPRNGGLPGAVGVGSGVVGDPGAAETGRAASAVGIGAGGV